MFLAFAGGVGGAKLARGLVEVLAPEELFIAVNTGDDFEHLGLHVSPDLDTVMYTLADCQNPETGWGQAGETWQFMDALKRLGGETWFLLGDRDLATHIERTRRLGAGDTLSDITADFCRRLGINHAVVPATDQPVRTVVTTDVGRLSFQDYFVRHKGAPKVIDIAFDGRRDATPNTRLQTLLDDDALEGIILCPSNPFLSVMPILSVPGIRPALEGRRVPLVAVSPIVGGKAIKGPAADIMRSFEIEVSAAGIAKVYGDLLDGLIIDTVDADLAETIANGGPEVLVTDTVMNSVADSTDLAHAAVSFARSLAPRVSGSGV